MSFSASTCLTDLGTTPLGPTLKIYSNPISPTSPGTFVLDVPTADVTGGNCPYVYELPDGTTSIRLSDPISGCYCDIPITNVENICITCDLNFISYEPTTVGKIVAGDISGSCDNNITDYLIYWYESSDPTTVKFTSGKGSDFSYLYPHPLSGLTAVPATSGTYSAVLQKIKLDGVIYSKTGGTGTVTSDLECLPSIENGNPIIVDALTCNNGGDSSDLLQYEHKFDYNAGTGGLPPIGLSTTFELSANTNYFAWKFKGNLIPDELKMTLIGSAYPVPIVLEYWAIGSELSYSNYDITSFPKSADTSTFVSKVTCLTGMTINEGDNILIEITPSTANTQTSWTFYCGCLDTFNCDICTLPTGSTIYGTSYQLPISGSTIRNVTASCNTTQVTFAVIGLSASCFTGSSYVNYMNLDYTYAVGNYYYATNTMFHNNVSCYQSVNNLNGSTPVCTNTGGTITYEKSSGLFKVTSTEIGTINKHYSEYISQVANRISPFSADSLNIGYYQYFEMNIPDSTGGTPCGDGTNPLVYRFHSSSIVTTGQTGGDYWIEYTMPTMTKGITYPTCDLGCDGHVNAIVTSVNDAATGTTNNYVGISTAGSSYLHPYKKEVHVVQDSDGNTGFTINQVIKMIDTQNITVPSSGETYTLIPSLSGETCPDVLDDFYYISYSPGRLNKYIFYYEVRLIDPLDIRNFAIYAGYLPKNGNSSNVSFKTKVYEFSGGAITYSDPNYIV